MIRLCFKHPRWPVLVVTPNLHLAHQWADEWNLWVSGGCVVVVDKNNIDSLHKVQALEIICITSYHYLKRQQVSVPSVIAVNLVVVFDTVIVVVVFVVVLVVVVIVIVFFFFLN